MFKHLSHRIPCNKNAAYFIKKKKNNNSITKEIRLLRTTQNMLRNVRNVTSYQ